MVLKHAAPFLADCYDNPSNRPYSSRASDDLHTGLHIFTQRNKDNLGFSVTTTPPGTYMHKRHPLHEELRKALNKHRTMRTPRTSLYKIVKGFNAYESLIKINSYRDRPIYPKVSDFMTITTAENVDDIISFLNTGTSTAFTYLTDLNTAYSYLTTPSLNSLAIQHQLKEELLYFLGLYNYVAASHTSINSLKQSLPQSASNSLTEGLEHNIRWSAFGYKSFAKMAQKAAEKLGAACLLLRYEATTHENTPQLGDLLIYNEDVVGPYILALRGQEYFDTAIRNGTLKPTRQNLNANKHVFHKPTKAPNTGSYTGKTTQRPALRQQSGPHHYKQDYQNVYPQQRVITGNQRYFRGPTNQNTSIRGQYQTRNAHNFQQEPPKNNGGFRTKTRPNAPPTKRSNK